MGNKKSKIKNREGLENGGKKDNDNKMEPKKYPSRNHIRWPIGIKVRGGLVVSLLIPVDRLMFDVDRLMFDVDSFNLDIHWIKFDVDCLAFDLT